MNYLFGKSRRRSRRNRLVSLLQRYVTIEQLEDRQLLAAVISSDVPKPILDLQTITSAIIVPDTAKTIVDVNVTLDITHTWVGDVEIFLIAPDGQRVELSTRNGSSGNDYNGTTFDDEAATGISQSTAPFAGVFRPEGLLSILRGGTPSGEWKLEIRDAASTDIGTLNSWSLDLTTDGAAVVDLVDISPDPRNTPVASSEVTFTGPIDISTFTIADLSLKRNGVVVPLNGGVTISRIGQTNGYLIDGLPTFTASKGNYILNVSVQGIKAADGGEVLGSVSDAWTVQGSQLLRIPDVSPNPRNVAVENIDTFFSFPLDVSTFTWRDVELRRNDDIVPLDASVTVSRIGASSRYRISGLAGFTVLRGSYEFTVKSSGILDQEGLRAEGTETTEWLVTGPKVLDVVDINPNPRNSGVNSIAVKFQFPLNIATFDIGDIELLRNGIEVPLGESVTIASGDDDTTYNILGLTLLTQQRGRYELRVAGNGVKDTFGRSGSGIASGSWDVIGPRVLRFTNDLPFIRNTPVDSLDIRFLFRPDLATFDFNDVTLRLNNIVVPLDESVTITQIDQTSTYRISGLGSFTSGAGSYSVSVSGRGVKDANGRIGDQNANIGWMLVGPDVSDITTTGPEKRRQPLDQAEVVLFFPADLATFNFHDVRLTRNGVNIPLNASVVVGALSPTGRYQISGLSSFTTTEGLYRLTVEGAGLSDQRGIAGEGSASTSWTMDTTPPRVVDVVNVTPDPRVGRGKSLFSIDVVFSERLDGTSFTPADVSLRRSNGPNLITDSVSIRDVGNKTYRIQNLASLTGTSGEYVFSVFGAVADLAGNVGTSIASDTWNAVDAPMITRLGTLKIYNEDSRPVSIGGNPSVTDADSSSFPGGSLTVSITSNANANDRLGILNRPDLFGFVGVAGNTVRFEGIPIGTFRGGAAQPLVVNLNANATPVAVEALVRSITFVSPGEYLGVNRRTVRFELNDGTGAVGQAEKSIIIQPVNDPSHLELGGPISYTRGTTEKSLAPNAVVQDIDSSVFTDHILRVKILSGSDGTERLHFDSRFVVVGDELRMGSKILGILLSDGQNGRALVVRLNSNTRDVLNQILRSITFRTEVRSSTSARTVEFSLHSQLADAGIPAAVQVSVM